MSESSGPRMGELLENADPSFSNVLQCVFGIDEHETRAYLVLLDYPGSTTGELSSALDRDRSTVSRTLSALLDRGLVRRERRLLDGGGYVYQYTAVPLPEAKEHLHEAVDVWTERVHEAIEAFDGE